MKVLVALESESLIRVVEHLFDNDPELKITRYLKDESDLAQHIHQTRPALAIVNGHFLKAGRSPLATGRRTTKLILVSRFLEHWKPADTRGVDAFLMDENLVERLPSIVRSLIGLRTRNGAVTVKKELK